MDPIEYIDIKKDSTFLMMLLAQSQGHTVYYIRPDTMVLRHGHVSAQCISLLLHDNVRHFFDILSEETLLLSDLDIIFMRVDPPFTMDYIYLTYLLELVEHEGVAVINKPQSIRDCNEKLFTCWFPHCCPETMVSSQIQDIQAFLEEQHEVIVKPLDGMGGEKIFYLHQGDKNTAVILETMTHRGKTRIMAQQYLPQARQGDKRITMIDGEPVSHAILRVPSEHDHRGNLAAGGQAHIVALTVRDRWLCEQVSDTLKKKGLRWVGLDVIGDYITEINVTSPTCLRELAYQEEAKTMSTLQKLFVISPLCSSQTVADS